MKASATARFAGGLGKVLLSHPKHTDMPASVWAIKKLEKRIQYEIRRHETPALTKKDIELVYLCLT